MTRLILLSSTALTLAAAPPAAAADLDAGAEAEVVVTAARLAVPAHDLVAARVIDRGEIERTGAVFAADVLERAPGVTLSRSGAFGGQTYVRIRGASPDKTLVLIDGVSVNDPTSPAGGFDFAALDLFDVERVEILSGPQGSLWGSDAIGGVVNVVTRAPDGFRALFEAGSYDTRRGAIAFGRRGETSAFGLSASRLRTDGISKADVRDGNTEADGFDVKTVSARASVELAPRARLAGGLRGTEAFVEYDSWGGPTGVVDGPETSDLTSLSLWGEARLDRSFGLDHALRLERFEMERADDGPYPYAVEGGRTSLRWTAGRDFGHAAFLAGVEHERSEAAGERARASGGFVVARLQATERLALQGSVRRDAPSRYDGETTARLSAAFALTPELTLQGAWGQGFKTPTIFQTTYDCGFCAPAGPARELRPERAEGADAGLVWRRGGARAAITAWRLQTRDQIDFVWPQGYRNIARARSEGVEIDGEVPLTPRLTLSAAFAWIDAEDQDGARLIRVPARSGSAALAWTGDRARAALTVRGKSRQADVYGPIDAFVVADLAAGWRLSSSVELTGRIENLTDEAYQQIHGYGEPGRSAYVGLRLRY